MFRVSEEFMILPLGYEHTTPILAQYQHFVHIQKVLVEWYKIALSFSLSVAYFKSHKRIAIS